MLNHELFKGACHTTVSDTENVKGDAKNKNSFVPKGPDDCMDLPDQVLGMEGSLNHRIAIFDSPFKGFVETAANSVINDRTKDDLCFSADIWNDSARGQHMFGLPPVTYNQIDRMHVETKYTLENFITSLCSTNVDISLSMNYIMESLAYQQSLINLIQSSSSHRPPPPPPPTTRFISESTQTELLSGEIDGMGDRLLLYRSRIKTLEESAHIYQTEVGRLASTVRDLRIIGNKEASKLERCIAELRRENNRLKEYSNLKDSKLVECNKLIDYYKEELKNVSSL